MKNYYLYILFLLAISFNTSLFAQDSEEDAVEVSTVEQLLMLVKEGKTKEQSENSKSCLLYTSPSPRDRSSSRMPSSA